MIPKHAFEPDINVQNLNNLRHDQTNPTTKQPTSATAPLITKLLKMPKYTLQHIAVWP